MAIKDAMRPQTADVIGIVMRTNNNNKLTPHIAVAHTDYEYIQQWTIFGGGIEYIDIIKGNQLEKVNNRITNIEEEYNLQESHIKIALVCAKRELLEEGHYKTELKNSIGYILLNPLRKVQGSSVGFITKIDEDEFNNYYKRRKEIQEKKEYELKETEELTELSREAKQQEIENKYSAYLETDGYDFIELEEIYKYKGTFKKFNHKNKRVSLRTARWFGKIRSNEKIKKYINELLE